MSNKFAVLRKELKLNQTDFAKELGIKQAYYSQIESGKKEPTIGLINTLINKFHVSPDWFFNNKGDIFNGEDVDIDISNIYTDGTIKEKKTIPVKVTIDNEKQLINVLSFMLFSNYQSNHNSDIQFDSFKKLGDNFSKIADFCFKVQSLMDIEFSKEITKVINSSTKSEAISVPKELESNIKKYNSIYLDFKEYKEAINGILGLEQKHLETLQSIARTIQ